jgi:hypothetical protein
LLTAPAGTATCVLAGEVEPTTERELSVSGRLRDT